MSTVGETMLSEEEIHELLGKCSPDISTKAVEKMSNGIKNVVDETKKATYDRADILNRAFQATKQRAQVHGKPENNFAIIAEMWSAYLDMEITAIDVANLMILFKVARSKTGVSIDNYVDIAGYAACGGELYGRNSV